MIAILTILLCAAIVVSALAAERSARARHRWRAVALNLFGLACLGVGLLAIFSWSHHGAVISHRLAMVDHGVHPAGSLVRLRVDSDGQVMPANNAGSDVTGDDDASPTAVDVEGTPSPPSSDAATDVPGVEQPAEHPPSQQARTTVGTTPRPMNSRPRSKSTTQPAPHGSIAKTGTRGRYTRSRCVPVRTCVNARRGKN